MNCPACNAAITETQRFCSVCGQPLSPASAPNSAVDAGERRQATVVFSDLSGYTALNEKIDPEEVEAIMGRIKREATSVIEKHGGIVNQFVGDEIMSFFGVPVARRDDPHRAVRASMELHRVVRDIGMEVAARIGRPLTMHTGINTGLIVIRRNDSREGRYAVTGDPINTGARLLGLADADEIVVGQDTWRQISDEFIGEERAPIEVRGKERPVIPYCVRSERAPTDTLQRALVGRTEEVDQFAVLVRSCAEQQRGRLIILRGDPGIGKSRLAQAFVSVAERDGFACHSALLFDFTTGRGRDTIRNLVRSLLTIRDDASEDLTRATIRRLIDDVIVASDQELFLCDLLNVSPPAELRTIQAAMSEEARDKGTSATLCNLVQQACAHKPVMLLIEDIHWADDWTLQQLTALATLTSKHKFLLVLTTRVEGDPSTLAWRVSLHNVPLTSIDLGPLPREDALRFAEQFGAIPEKLADSLVARAEGNPLFLQQLLLNAEEMGAGLPGSIQALVLARMDRLLTVDRKAIQTASVLGQRFSMEALRELLDDPTYQCTALIEHFLVRPEGMDYLFCHALIRDGAYESLLKSRRRELHTRAAEWFSDHAPAVAAEHYDRAGHPQAARAYLVASEAEATRYRYSGALAHAERGLALAATREDKFSLASMRAKILHDMGRAYDSIEAWRSALESSEGAPERCSALIGIAQGMRILDRTLEGLAVLAEADPLAREARLSLELSRIHHLRGNYYFGLGKAEECLYEHETALRWARESGSSEAEANALGGLGDAHYLSGRMRSAYEQFRHCIELTSLHGLGRIEVANKHMLGWSLIYMNELRSALKVGLETTRMAVAVSHQRGEILGRLLQARAMAWMLGGDTQASRIQLDTVLKLCQTLGAKRFESECMVDRAFLELRDGNRELAKSLSRDALQFCRENGMDFFGSVALGLASRLTSDPTERENLSAEAEARLKRGAISHNHFEFYSNAIDSALERSAWNEVEYFCDALDAYTKDEPLPFCDLQIARGRRLAQFGRGARDGKLIADLLRLREQAIHHEYGVVVPALDAALKQAEINAS